jgi:hypothetical protein
MIIINKYKLFSILFSLIILFFIVIFVNLPATQITAEQIMRKTSILNGKKLPGIWKKVYSKKCNN